MNQSLLDKAYDWLTTQRGDASKEFTYDTGCAVFKAFDAAFKGGNQTTVCHSALRRVGGITPVGVATLSNWAAYDGNGRYTGISYGPKYDKTRLPDTANRFYDWFINRSFARSYISAPSFEFARDVGIVVTADAPSNMVGAICTLSRTMSEHPHYSQRMMDLIDKFGMSEELAFAISFGINIGYSGSNHGYGDTNTNHTIIALTADLSYIRNFVNRTPVKLSAPYSVTQDYTGIMNMWGSGSRYETSTELLERDLKPFIRKKADKAAADTVVIPNPFARVAVESSTWSDEQLHETYIPALMEATQHENVSHIAHAA